MLEDELMTSCKDDTAGEMRFSVRYFSIEVPTKADADGLIACLQRTLQTLGVDNESIVLGAKPILISGGTDGVSVNVAEQG